MIPLIIATHNVHKIREFRSLLKDEERFDVLSLLNFSSYTLPPETGETFHDNAVLKAEDAARALKQWTIADDSGLVVPALGGAPGVRSRRYAGEDATDAENRQKLLKDLQGKQDQERWAYYECCLALAGPDGKLKKVVTGICEGIILEEERGRNGFGYDSLFIKHEYDKTFAEIDETIKNKISHRGKALAKLILALCPNNLKNWNLSLGQDLLEVESRDCLGIDGPGSMI